MESNAKLSLKDLTLKTTILLALTSSARAHELAALHLDFISKKKHSWEFTIPQHVRIPVQISTEETFPAIISGKPKSWCNRELKGLYYENSSNLQGTELTSLVC